MATLWSFKANTLSLCPFSGFCFKEGLLPKHQLWNSQWPIYIINSVDKTRIILLYSPTIAAPQFLKKKSTHFTPQNGLIRFFLWLPYCRGYGGSIPRMLWWCFFLKTNLPVSQKGLYVINHIIDSTIKTIHCSLRKILTLQILHLLGCHTCVLDRKCSIKWNITVWLDVKKVTWRVIVRDYW